MLKGSTKFFENIGNKFYAAKKADWIIFALTENFIIANLYLPKYF